jgi:protein phosphatase
MLRNSPVTQDLTQQPFGGSSLDLTPIYNQKFMLEAFGVSDPGCVRTNNEDYYLLAPSLDLYLVADGMGGAQAGEHASKLAGDTVAEFVLASGQVSGEVLLNSIMEANRRIFEESEADPAFHGMGTTLTVAWRVGEELLLANVGDSRAYVYQGDQLHIITEDQTWVNEVGRKLGINEEQLKVHPMRHVLTMAIGVSDTVRVHSYAVPLEPGAQFLLCSDGLHGIVDSRTIAETLAADGTLESKCNALVEAAKQAGGPDNITAVLLAAR